MFTLKSKFIKFLFSCFVSTNDYIKQNIGRREWVTVLWCIECLYWGRVDVRVAWSRWNERLLWRACGIEQNGRVYSEWRCIPRLQSEGGALAGMVAYTHRGWSRVNTRERVYHLFTTTPQTADKNINVVRGRECHSYIGLMLHWMHTCIHLGKLEKLSS